MKRKPISIKPEQKPPVGFMSEEEALLRVKHSPLNAFLELQKREKLAAEIEAFLQEHAKPAAGYDPQNPDDDLKYNGPDSYELENAANTLRSGNTLHRVPWAGWESGCFKGDGKALLQELLDRCKAFVTSS